MAHGYASRPGAACGHPVRSPAARRPNLSTADRLEQLVDRFDALVRDVRIGARNQREHDEHATRAEELGNALIALFRKPTPQVRIQVDPAPVHPPLHLGRGHGIW